jgi:hypothetical protein
MADNKREQLETAQQTHRIPGKDELANISTSDLEAIIGEMFLDAESNNEKLNELLEEYETRDGVPHVDVEAAWERFKRDYRGQGEIYLTSDSD